MNCSTSSEKILLAVAGLLMGAVTSSCALYSDSGNPGNTPQCTRSQLTLVSPASQQECPCGGVVINEGPDINCDGTLQSSEVSSTNVVCSGVASCSPVGPPDLVASISLPIGDAHCPYGGTETEVGVDTNGDGILEITEITSTQYLCSSAPLDGGQPVVVDAGVTDDAPSTPRDGGLTIAQSSPWPMYQSGPSLQGRSAAVGPSNPIVKWSVPGTFDQPSIAADGTLYAHNYDTASLEAILPDGTVSWTFSSDDGGDFVGTPAILSDGTIVIGTKFDSGVNEFIGTLYALTPTGAVAWSLALAGAAQGSPSIGADGTIYVISDRYLDVGPVGEFSFELQAVHPNGANWWSSASWTTGSDVAVTDMPAISSDGTIYLGMSCGLVAIAADGTQKWTYNDPSGECVAAQSVGDDGTIYAMLLQISPIIDTTMVALNPQGTRTWSLDLGDNVGEGLAVGPDGTILFNGWYSLVAVSPSGSQDWSAVYGIGNEAPPAIVDGAGTAYFSDQPYVGTCGECPPMPVVHPGVQALARDGSPTWLYQPIVAINPPAIGADGTLYTNAFGDDGSLGLCAIGEMASGGN